MFNSDELRQRIADWSVPEATTGCWLWLGKVDRSGYGEVSVGSHLRRAHRVSYEAFAGPIPAGKMVLHRCDQPSCVNPDHLYVGTAKENMRDCVDRGRHGLASRTHCKNGHELTPENVSLYVDKRGWRVRRCKACRLAHVKAWKKENPEAFKAQRQRSKRKRLSEKRLERFSKIFANHPGPRLPQKCR